MSLQILSYRNEDVFQFEWWRDKHGYELVPGVQYPRDGNPQFGSVVEPADADDNYGTELRSGRDFYVRRKGGPLEAYRPLEEITGLHRQFASLRDTPSAKVMFANQFGLPGLTDEKWAPSHGIIPEAATTPVAVGEWNRVVIGVGDILGAHDEAATEDDASKLSTVVSLFNEHVEPQMTVRLGFAGSTRRVGLNVHPTSLIGAIWLQVANEITNDMRFRKCRLCSNWFPYGPGTGHKDTKRFCSDRCRVAWNRQQKRMGQ